MIGGAIVKIGSNKLKMGNGTIRTFKSKAKRDAFERVARAIKHGWKPSKRGK